jgi:hypothetical protein
MTGRATVVATLACTLVACHVPIARFTVVGDPSATHAGTTAPAAGTSCRWWIAGVHFGLPQVDEALAAALARAGTGLLGDAELVSIHEVFGLVGRHCYELTGTPWHEGRGGRPPVD